jgi:acyl carrier protein
MNELALQQDIDTVSALVRRVASDGACPAQLTEATRFVEDVGMESINRLMLMTLLEQEFGINLEQHMSTLVELHTIGATARFIHALREGQQP